MPTKGVASDTRSHESTHSPFLTSIAGVRRDFARASEQIARLADPWCQSWVAAALVSLLVGIAPVVANLSFRTSVHQSMSAVVLAPFVWSCARRGNWAMGMCLLASTFFWHSIAMIVVAQYDPAIASFLTPDGDAYWAKQFAWITTGTDPEYEFQAWGPAHAQLFCGTTIFSLTSFGIITLQQGFYEVDLMNYYNARMMLASRDSCLALCYGWHLWSLLRGCGYVILTYELTSMGLQLAMGRSLATWRGRVVRWSAGISFLLLDAATKWWLLELVRCQLLANLA